MQKTFTRCLLMACLLLLLVPTAHAAKLAGVTMDDTVSVDGQKLVLNGLGLRKKAIFKIYVGGLYLPAKQTSAEKILAADTARHMVMEILYSKLSAEQLADAWKDCLAANTPNAPAAVKSGFDELQGWMEEVAKGGRLTFSYQPATGTKVEVGGSAKGTITGKDFADALFACWVGDKPATSALKKGLLGG